jgi:hypothetical protein
MVPLAHTLERRPRGLAAGDHANRSIFQATAGQRSENLGLENREEPGESAATKGSRSTPLPR